MRKLSALLAAAFAQTLAVRLHRAAERALETGSPDEVPALLGRAE